MDIFEYVKQAAERVNASKAALAASSTALRNRVLIRAAELLLAESASILAENVF